MSDFIQAKWKNLIMANYALDPKIIRPYLPPGVQLDVYQDTAYVSLVAFMFSSIKLFKVPIPFFGSFEEINLRFYVKRQEPGRTKRGVVFINEFIPYKTVSRIANWLYHEHYSSIPTKHRFEQEEKIKKVEYRWKKDNQWNTMRVKASNTSEPMQPNSIEEFIFEHYFGYTKINEYRSMEYVIEHPRWNVYPVDEFEINCDFKSLYGEAFSFLNHQTPSSVLLAEGSPVTIRWKRNTLS